MITSHETRRRRRCLLKKDVFLLFRSRAHARSVNLHAILLFVVVIIDEVENKIAIMLSKGLLLLVVSVGSGIHHRYGGENDDNNGEG